MRVAIIGSRKFPHLTWVREYVYRKLEAGDIVVSGAAPGVDRMAAEAARLRGLQVEEYPADWDRGKQAGKDRNWDIVRAADRVVAFWDGESNGTAHGVTAALSLDKPVKVYSSRPREP